MKNKRLIIALCLSISPLYADVITDHIAKVVVGALLNPCSSQQNKCSFKKRDELFPTQGENWHLTSVGLDLFREDPLIHAQKIHDHIGILETHDFLAPDDKTLEKKFKKNGKQGSPSDQDFLISHGLQVALMATGQEGAYPTGSFKYSSIENEKNIEDLLNDKSVKVLNLSFSSKERNPNTEKLVKAAGKKGKTLIFSSGNDGKQYNSSLSVQKAIHKKSANVLYIGSLSGLGVPSHFSNTGRHVDFYFPGEGMSPIESDYDSSYESFNNKSVTQGTSFSAPLFSAMLASFMNIYPQYSFDEWVELLNLSAIKKGPFVKSGEIKIPNPHLLLTAMKEAPLCHHLKIDKVACLEKSINHIKSKHTSLPTYDGNGGCSSLENYYRTCRKNYFLSGGSLNINQCIDNLFPEAGNSERFVFYSDKKMCQRTLELSLPRFKYKSHNEIQEQIDNAQKLCSPHKRDPSICHKKTLQETEDLELIKNDCFVSLCARAFTNECTDAFISLSIDKKEDILRLLLNSPSSKDDTYLSLFNEYYYSDAEVVRIFALLGEELSKKKTPKDRSFILSKINHYIDKNQIYFNTLLDKELNKIATLYCNELDIQKHKNLLRLTSRECQPLFQDPKKDERLMRAEEMPLDEYIKKYPTGSIPLEIALKKENVVLFFQHLKNLNYNHPLLSSIFDSDLQQILPAIPKEELKPFLKALRSSPPPIYRHHHFFDLRKTAGLKKEYSLVLEEIMHEEGYRDEFISLLWKKEICHIDSLSREQKEQSQIFLNEALKEKENPYSLQSPEEQSFEQKYKITARDTILEIAKLCSDQEFSESVAPFIFEGKTTKDILDLLHRPTISNGNIELIILRHFNYLRKNEPEQFTKILQDYDTYYLKSKHLPLSVSFIEFLFNFKEGKNLLKAHRAFIEPSINCELFKQNIHMTPGVKGKFSNAPRLYAVCKARKKNALKERSLERDKVPR
jgi:hypothetical protein